MLTREDVITKIQSFTNEITLGGLRLDRVILFGSYAKNQQREYSDIDVMLVSDMFIGIGFIDRKLFSKINIKKEFMDIETKTYPSKYFEQGDPFIDEILKTGIEVKTNIE